MATSPQETRKRLALAIIDFLNTSLTDGSLPADDRESIEVATSCIADSFKVDPTDKAAVADAVGQDQNLLKIYSVYEKLRGKSTPSTEGSSSAAEGRPKSPQTSGEAPSDAQKAEAEKLKGQGNVAMQQKDYKTAIDMYSKAIEISPTNPIYLSNRAAAYSGSQQHEQAKQDAEMATSADPKYTKAWSRLGLASFALGDAQASMEAYKKGIEAEGNGGSDAMKKGYETAKRKVEQEGSEDDVGSPPRSTSPPAAGAGGGGMPDLGSLAGMLGGGGGGGGMPDMSALMNNPMMKSMMDNVMQNPDMLNNIMNNPRMREMANQFGGGGGGGGGGQGGGQGGGMPDMSALMNDPNLAEMARNFMGGQGGAGGGGAGRGAGS